MVGCVETNPGRAIFWDFDGTLAWQPEGWSGVLLKALRRWNSSTGIERDNLRPFLQTGFPWHTPDVGHPHVTSADLWWEALGGVFVRAFRANGIPPDVARQSALDVRSIHLDPASWVVNPAASVALGRLRDRGYRQYILSNHVPELPDLVGQLGLSRWFDAVLTSGEMGYEKPHPEAYRIALRRAGCPKDAWMIGDNPVADVAGAERMGIKGILVARNEGQPIHGKLGLIGAAEIIIADKLDR